VIKIVIEFLIWTLISSNFNWPSHWDLPMMAMICSLPSSPKALVLMQKSNFFIVVINLLSWISQHKNIIIQLCKKCFKIYCVLLPKNINNFRRFYNHHRNTKMFHKIFQKISLDLEPWIVVVATIFNYVLCCSLSCKHLCFCIECDKWM